LKKPARVADNKFTMPYGDNVSAPAFTLPDVDGYKKSFAAEAGHKFHTKFKEIEDDYNELMDQAIYNTRILNASMSFKPIIGNVYHLYKSNNQDFMSLISPEEWGESYMKTKTFLGSYKLKSDNVWERVDDPDRDIRVQEEMVTRPSGETS